MQWAYIVMKCSHDALHVIIHLDNKKERKLRLDLM